METNAEQTNPLEDLFEMEPDTDDGIEGDFLIAEDTTDDVIAPIYDEKDTAIDKQLEEIRGLAIDEFKVMRDGTKMMEPRYRGRNMEVAVQMLKVALDSTSKKADIKGKKDELKVPTSVGDINQTNIFVDRNELLKELMNKAKTEAIEAKTGTG